MKNQKPEIWKLWTDRVRRLKASNLPLKQFAAYEGISPSTLRDWIARVNPQQQKPQPVNFVEIAPYLMTASNTPIKASIQSQHSNAFKYEPFELAFKNNLRITIPSQFDPVALRQLITILEGK